MESQQGKGTEETSICYPGQMAVNSEFLEVFYLHSPLLNSVMEPSNKGAFEKKKESKGRVKSDLEFLFQWVTTRVGKLSSNHIHVWKI